MKKKNKLTIYWVLANGKDCDGCNSGHVTAYQSREEAYKCANELSEWSDGLTYYVTDKLEDLERYCDDYDKEINNYKTI